MSHALSAEELQIELTPNSALLTWPGEELLFSSSTLQDFILVEGAQSPFEQTLSGTDRLFFQLRSLPEVLAPISDSTVGTELIDIQGLVGGVLSDAEGLSVTVNGQNAQIEANTAGESIFVLRDFTLALGANSLTVIFSTSEGVQQTQNLTVTYDPVTANNVVIAGDYAYAAQGADGVAIIHLETRSRTTLTVNNAVPQVDDLSFDGTFLFTLNAGSTNNALSAYSLENPANPTLVSGPVAATSGFFSGVSAANGRVAVAGGTSALFVRTYDTETGAISNLFSSLDFVIGHPDVLLSEDGELAHVSVDFPNGPNNFRFGIVTVALNAPPASSVAGAEFGLTNLDGNFSLSAGGQDQTNFAVESALVNDRLLVTSGNNLSILNADGSSFQSSLPMGFFTVNVDGDGATAFVVGAQNGTPTLAEVDFTDPNNPSITSSTTFPGAGQFTGVAVNEDFVVIAANDGGLRVIAR